MPHKYEKSLKKILTRFGVKMRVVHGVLVFWALLNITAQRLCLDMMLERKNLIKGSEELDSSEDCDLPDLRPSAKWQQAIWVSFYVGYVATHVFGGWLLKKFEHKTILSVSLFSTCILTIMAPLLIDYQSLLGILLVRFALGLSEGPIYPVCSALLAKWVPNSEKGKIGVFAFSGIQIGTFLIHSLCYDIFQPKDWHWIIFLSGLSSCCWLVAFSVLGSDSPEENYFTTNSEKRFIKRSRKPLPSRQRTGQNEQNEEPSGAAWQELVGTFQHSWNEVNMNMVTYYQLAEGQLLDKPSVPPVASQGLLNLAKWMLSMGAGYMNDYLVNNDVVDKTKLKQFISSLGLLIPNLVEKANKAGKANGEESGQNFNWVHSCFDGLGSYFAGVTDYSALPLAVTRLLPEVGQTIDVDTFLLNLSQGVRSVLSTLVPLLANLDRKP